MACHSIIKNSKYSQTNKIYTAQLECNPTTWNPFSTKSIKTWTKTGNITIKKYEKYLEKGNKENLQQRKKMVNLSAQPGATGYHIQSTSRCELESSLSQSYRSYRLSALQWRSRYRDDDTSILDPGLRCLWWPVGCRRSRTEGAPPARRSRRFWRRLLPSTWAPSIDWKQKNISSVLRLNMTV